MGDMRFVPNNERICLTSFSSSATLTSVLFRCRLLAGAANTHCLPALAHRWHCEDVALTRHRTLESRHASHARFNCCSVALRSDMFPVLGSMSEEIVRFREKRKSRTQEPSLPCVRDNGNGAPRALQSRLNGELTQGARPKRCRYLILHGELTGQSYMWRS